MTGTTAAVSVGQIALRYGYDPEEPAEKLFVISVVNAGTAVTATAKTAAMRDISRLTQALVRGKSWNVLNDAVIAKVYGQFAKAFEFRLTRQGLGKAVPAVGIIMGSALNWATLESTVDLADMAYRRRFLLEKYPHLAGTEEPGLFFDIGTDVQDDDAEAISVLGELTEAGGPDLG